METTSSGRVRKLPMKLVDGYSVPGNQKGKRNSGSRHHDLSKQKHQDEAQVMAETKDVKPIVCQVLLDKLPDDIVSCAEIHPVSIVWCADNTAVLCATERDDDSEIKTESPTPRTPKRKRQRSSPAVHKSISDTEISGDLHMEVSHSPSDDSTTGHLGSVTSSSESCMKPLQTANTGLISSGQTIRSMIEAKLHTTASSKGSDNVRYLLAEKLKQRSAKKKQKPEKPKHPRSRKILMPLEEALEALRALEEETALNEASKLQITNVQSLAENPPQNASAADGTNVTSSPANGHAVARSPSNASNQIPLPVALASPSDASNQTPVAHSVVRSPLNYASNQMPVAHSVARSHLNTSNQTPVARSVVRSALNYASNQTPVAPSAARSHSNASNQTPAAQSVLRSPLNSSNQTPDAHGSKTGTNTSVDVCAIVLPSVEQTMRNNKEVPLGVASHMINQQHLQRSAGKSLTPSVNTVVLQRSKQIGTGDHSYCVCEDASQLKQMLMDSNQKKAELSQQLKSEKWKSERLQMQVNQLQNQVKELKLQLQNQNVISLIDLLQTTVQQQ